MSGTEVVVLVAVGVVLVVVLLVVLARRGRTPVLGDVSGAGTQPGSGWSAPPAGAAPLPDAGTVPGVDELLARNDRIGAVKAYRDATGASLRDATDAVTNRHRGRPTPGTGQPDLTAVRQLLGAGRKIEAIKVYRQLTGVGLREAKETVERLAATGQIPDRGQLPDPAQGMDLSEVRQLLYAGRKIEAIKVYRQLTGVGLREAKAAVERGSW
jgi:ribosomal protein L7/L12